MIIFLLSLLISFSYSADQLELSYSFLSYHVPNNPTDSHKYSNKLGNGQAITNPLLGLRRTRTSKNGSYEALTVFSGSNSVGTNMSGLVYSTGEFIDSNWYIGFVVGGYTQSRSEFRHRGIETMGVGITHDQEIQPIVGAEVGYKYDINSKWFIRQNNVITPFITNHSLSIGFSF